MKKLLLFLIPFLFTITAYSQNGYSSVFLRVTDSATFVNSANTTAKHAANYADIWYSVSSGLFWKWSTVTNTYTMISEGGNFWKNAGTTNLTGDATVDNGAHNLLMGDITGPYSSWDIDGAGPLAIPNSRTDGVGDPASATHSYIRHAISGGDSEAFISVKNSTGSEVSYITVSASATPAVVFGTTGIIEFQTNGVERFHIEADGSWDLGPTNDPGTSGYVLTSNGAGAAPTWVAPSGGGGGVNTFAPNIQTGDYTAVIGDTIQVIYMRNVSTPQTLTIPLNVFPVGSFITVVQDTTAVTTVAGAAGVDIVGRLTLTQKESAVFHQRSTNAWVRLGGVDQEWIAWTPTFTGFSVNPTGAGGYIVEGKKVTIYYNTTSLGTSNATTFTITNLPFAPKDTMVRLSYVVNNAGGVVGRFLINDGSTTVTFGATPAGSGGFTGSSTKGASFDFTYEID